MPNVSAREIVLVLAFIGVAIEAVLTRSWAWGGVALLILGHAL
jgi:hypothetical protein